MQRHALTIAHSPDPDDVFMWWPLTGKVSRAHGATPSLPPLTAPILDTGPFTFHALPMDIEILNRRAAADHDLDITALSLRAWNDVSTHYRLTRTGSSFGDGYGPKIVKRPGAGVGCEECLGKATVKIAIPGRRTTAFLVTSLLMGREAVERPAPDGSTRIIEMPFDQVIQAVARGDAAAGLLIHEGQVTYEQAGLTLVIDLGAWWKERTGLPLPLGVNAIRRDIDSRYGPGSSAHIASLLRQSLDYALVHRDESLDYALTFALESPDGRSITRDRVNDYINMYVNTWTIDMGDRGIESITRLLTEGAAQKFCPAPGPVDPI